MIGEDLAQRRVKTPIGVVAKHLLQRFDGRTLDEISRLGRRLRLGFGLAARFPLRECGSMQHHLVDP